MGVGSEALIAEDVIARPDHSLIVDIDVCYINPGSQAVLLEGQSHRLDAVQVFIENKHRLDIGVGSPCLIFAQSDAVEDKGVFFVSGLDKYGDFRTIEWLLFDNRAGGLG